jgi:hypothetical protein
MAYTALPLLDAALRELPGQSSITLIDSRFSAESLQNLSNIWDGMSPHPIQLKTTITTGMILRKLKEWQREAIQLKPDNSGGAWALMTHAEHLNLLQPALDVLSESQDSHYLVAGQTIKLPNQIVHSLPSIPQGNRLEQCIRHIQDLLNQIQRLSKDDQIFCLSQMDLFLDLCKKLLIFEGFLQQHQPQTVIGCLEYNSFGVIAGLLKEQYGYRLINVQHGIISPMWAFDGMRFDDYLIWSKTTAEVLQQEQYPNPASFRIVGNPKWEVLETTIRQQNPSPVFQEIMDWKKNTPLVGAYTQALQGYSTTGTKVQYVDALLKYLKTHSDVKLLIKKHPLENDSIVSDLVSVSGLQDRVRVFSASELPLWESLKAVDVVTSVFSATLLEALYLRKPTIAIDLENTIAKQEIPMAEALRVVTQMESLQGTLDEAFKTNHSFSVSDVQNLVPRFENTYQERVKEALFNFKNVL